jgi:hypothetical protein
MKAAEFLRKLADALAVIEDDDVSDAQPEQDVMVPPLQQKIEIPYTTLPYRRNGKFLCLPHQTEGLITIGGIDKWVKGETTARNEKRYILEMQQGKIDYKSDGINSMKYELLSIDTIYNKHKIIYSF